MNRSELEHAIRAACDIAGDDELIIIGSQAILGQFPDAPEELRQSEEVDLYPKNRPGRSDAVDGAIGERSAFHDTHHFYVHGVGPETAVLPAGWESRLVRVRNSNTRGCTGWCIEVHDLAASKLVPGREKDIEFVASLALGDVEVLDDDNDRSEARGIESEPAFADLCSPAVTATVALDALLWRAVGSLPA